MPFDPVSISLARRALPPRIESYGTGIIGNGVADDSVAFTSACNAAYADGVTLVWCERTYNVPTLGKTMNVILVGPGVLLNAPYRRYIIPLNAPRRNLAPRIQRRHMATFLATGSPVVTMVGDSNAVERVAGATIQTLGRAMENVAKSDTLPAQIRRKILAENRAKTITWQNRSIGGSAWEDALTNTAAGKPAEWYSPTSNTWDTFYSNSHLIFAHWGTNGAGNNLATNAMAAWRTAMKTLGTAPDLIWSTLNGRSRQLGADNEFTASNDRDRMAGAMRTIAEFYDDGVLDNHRQAVLARDGVDVCQSTMERRLDLENTSINSTYTFNELVSDYEVGISAGSGTFVLPSGGRSLEFALSSQTGWFNVARVRNVGGFFQVEVQWESGLLQPGHPITTLVPVPAGQMTIDFSIHNGTLAIEVQTLSGATWINTPLFYGAIVRYGGLFPPRFRMSDNSSVSFTLNWAAFGRPVVYMPEIVDWQAWGWPSGVSNIAQASRGGNSVNHPGSDFYSRVTQVVVERENLGPA